MATEKEVLLIQRLLSEGADDLAGEWWITQDGDLTYDDGDVGQYAHQMKIMEHALGIQLDEAGIPILPMEPFTPLAIRYLKQQGAPEEAIEYFENGADAYPYAVTEMDWIHVKDNNFTVNELNNAAANRVSAFLNNQLNDDRGNILIEEYSSGSSRVIPAWMIMNHPDQLDAIIGYDNNLTEDDIINLVSMISEDLVPLALSVMEQDEPEPVQKEYEQRIDLKQVPDGANNPSKIRQGLLFDKPGFNLRIRKETKDGNDTYTLTCKFYKKSDESEVEITKDMFERLWPETLKPSRMNKTRYQYEDWVVDDIHEPASKNGIVAEIETETQDQQVDIPDEFDLDEQ